MVYTNEHIANWIDCVLNKLRIYGREQRAEVIGICWETTLYDLQHSNGRDICWRWIESKIRKRINEYKYQGFTHELPPDDLLADNTTTIEQIEAKEFWNLIRRYTTAKERQVIKLRYMQGLSYSLIAQETNYTKPGVADVIHRVLQRLRDKPI